MGYSSSAYYNKMIQFGSLYSSSNAAELIGKTVTYTAPNYSIQAKHAKPSIADWSPAPEQSYVTDISMGDYMPPKNEPTFSALNERRRVEKELLPATCGPTKDDERCGPQCTKGFGDGFSFIGYMCVCVIDTDMLKLYFLDVYERMAYNSEKATKLPYKGYGYNEIAEDCAINLAVIRRELRRRGMLADLL